MIEKLSRYSGQNINEIPLFSRYRNALDYNFAMTLQLLNQKAMGTQRDKVNGYQTFLQEQRQIKREGKGEMTIQNREKRRESALNAS